MRRISLFFLILAMSLPFSAQAINCTWDVVPTNINFGSYLPFSGVPATGTSSFKFTCTPPAVATLMLSRGDFSVFLHRPLALAMLATAAVLLVLTLMPRLAQRREEIFHEGER